jgi:pSer/pThr/pTyr-binding forkhead associated (FHA) protein
MWAIKVLNGPQSGKIFPLQKGNNILGRSPKVDIRLADTGVSKSHAQIFVTNDKVIISDLKSINGTFVNGIQVQNHGLKTGDKILVNKTIFTIFQLPDNVVFASKEKMRGQHSLPPAQNRSLAVQGSNALQTMSSEAPDTHNQQHLSLAIEPQGIQQLITKADNYIEEVALSPLYRTVEKVDFKYVLFGFSLAFIFLATFLSIFPLARITNESVMNESMRRAMTLAHNLAQMNRNALADDSELGLTTDFITHESGVEKAYIVSASSGGILAPSNMVGRYIKDPFIIGLRSTTQEKVESINATQVAASVPMKLYNPEVGDSAVVAFAVVVYNIDPLSVDFNRTLSLFIQIFLIAAILGSIVYLIQYRLMIRPLGLLNIAIDKALRDGTSDIQVPFKLKVFQDLISNINSAMSRISTDFTETESVAAHGDKNVEASEVVKLFPIPAMAVDPINNKFVATNPSAQGHPLFDNPNLTGTSLDDLTDKSLYESLKDLIQTCTAAPNSKHTNILPSRGSESYEISAKAIINGKVVSYILLTVMQIIEEDGE